MNDEQSFEDVLDRLSKGDENAATEVFTRYTGRLIGLARSRLNARLRQKEDPEDVVQSVLRSFFTRHADGQFDLEGWDSLWSLLATITLRKCGRRIERFGTAGRDVSRARGGQPGSLRRSTYRWIGWTAPSGGRGASIRRFIEGPAA